MKNKWKKFFSYYKPYKGLFCADMVFAILGAAVALTIPLVIRYITNDVILREPDAALRSILLLATLMAGLVLVELVSNFFITYYGHIMGSRMEYDMRNEIFEHYQKLSFAFYDNQKVGQLMSRVTNDLFDISELFHHGPEDIFISLIKFIGSFVILMQIDVKLAVAAFVLIPFMFIFSYLLNGKMKRAFTRNRARIADVNAQIEDNLSGIRVVKSFANEEIEMEKFQEGNHRFLESKRDSYRYMAQFHSGLGAFVTMITIFVIVTGAVLVTRGSVKVTDLIIFLLYIGTFTEPVRKLINFTETFQNGISGYERFYEILCIEPDIKDKKNALEIKSVNGDIVFKDVSFKYEESQEEVIHHINLQVNEGDYVAIVGPSGVGKTTLCSLIPRFYEVSSGSISINGINIKDIKVNSLRRSIGIVQQDVYLFVGSVMENIRYGKPDATDEEVVQAAQKANAHDFIMQLPGGYLADIGQRGVKLSGGQKQRLSIARVFLKNPPILIFDEATSSLDNESEKIVQESLERLTKDRTTLVIAHRLTTIRNAKRILVLTGNGIEEDGTHQELMALNGVYASLYSVVYN
ncbi:ABC transporter ATP-binding protein [Parasporobacterium paucivorans]|uniref:ATP-binding cassette, subfamily B n=1 Tax=Parasporobacterium paucivorans DSM 15970 TaxID=1122934 RepID=A0A1M6KF22_9FIRM|nr:ABC transporter ATP-binding protein [Parasporobacterium paucivorans]SHJ57534.1 ATP-binding cassette, subfamily B [Parasporobacterium paucivorans DSM 15970]